MNTLGPDCGIRWTEILSCAILCNGDEIRYLPVSNNGTVVRNGDQAERQRHLVLMWTPVTSS